MVLQLKGLGIDNIMKFEWLAPPPAEAMVKALEQLHALGALDSDARLTAGSGVALAALPLEPPLAKCLLAAGQMGCAEEVLTVVAMLSVPSVWAGGHRGGHVNRCAVQLSNICRGLVCTPLPVRWMPLLWQIKYYLSHLITFRCAGSWTRRSSALLQRRAMQ